MVAVFFMTSGVTMAHQKTTTSSNTPITITLGYILYVFAYREANYPFMALMISQGTKTNIALYRRNSTAPIFRVLPVQRAFMNP